MKPWEQLAEARTPDGQPLTLVRHDQEYVILANRLTLMSSRTHGSEEALATMGCAQARRLSAPRVLVGGLGIGFTLRAALDILPAKATVIVCELVPAVVEWNRGPLGPLANHPLDDTRVQVKVGDVAAALRTHRQDLDAILLDIDNGPSPTADEGNRRLYDARGLSRIKDALATGGILAVWSTREDHRFEERLRQAGFTVKTEHVLARSDRGRARHVIFTARA